MDWNVSAEVPTLDTPLHSSILRHAVSHQSDVVSGSGGDRVTLTRYLVHRRVRSIVRRNIRCFKLLVTLSGFGPRYQGSFQLSGVRLRMCLISSVLRCICAPAVMLRGGVIVLNVL